ncbi:MAG: hypothetical protein ACLVEJ_09370 [Parabacteroides sp.]
MTQRLGVCGGKEPGKGTTLGQTWTKEPVRCCSHLFGHYPAGPEANLKKPPTPQYTLINNCGCELTGRAASATLENPFPDVRPDDENTPYGITAQASLQ